MNMAVLEVRSLPNMLAHATLAQTIPTIRRNGAIAFRPHRAGSQHDTMTSRLFPQPRCVLNDAKSTIKMHVTGVAPLS